MDQEQVRIIIAAACYTIYQGSIRYQVYDQQAGPEQAIRFTGRYSQNEFRLETDSIGRVELKPAQSTADEKIYAVRHSSYGKVAEITVKNKQPQQAQDMRNRKIYSSIKINSSQVQLNSDTLLVK